MSKGKSARSKGKRGEYMLRDALRALGYTADRVPSSGAAQGFPGDVKATKGDSKLLFECKNRKCAFTSIYTYLNEHGGGKVGVILSDNSLCEFSTSLESILDTHNQLFVSIDSKRLDSKLRNMWKLLKGANILAVRDNHKPFIYFRYY